MKKKIKLSILIGILVISFILFLFFLTSAKNYHKEYAINDIKINESFDKKTKAYSFSFNYKDITLDYLVSSKYKQARKLIKDVKVIENENDFCLVPSSDTLKTMPICYQDGKQVFYSLVKDEIKKDLGEEYQTKEFTKKATYEEIDIYNTDYSYLVWNYQDSFNYINGSTSKKINLFNKESYKISLVGYTTDYLIIADYDSNYTFNKIYTIEFNNGNKKEYKLDRNIYFDSYFVGFEDNKAFIVDNKESIMYEINAKNGKIEKIKSKVLVDGKWENKDIKSLVNKNYSFTYNTPFKYTMEDNNLYLSYKGKDNKILITENITSIIRTKNNKVFYLKDKDTLYAFDPVNGEEKLAYYYGWYFYSDGLIYIN